MSKIHLGNANQQPAYLDIETLISTRLLITASSGGGKSETIRRILEEAHGHIQCIVIDPEGEFSTLRERFPFVLVGEGGETTADIRTAALVATRLLELNVSAVCDLYEMRIQDRHEWVKRFLESMVNAPKNLWHPVIVILDEAHTFCLDETTEILTEAGWKKHAEIVVGETLPCYDIESQSISIGAVERKITRPYCGDMIAASSDGIDALMTPDHRMVIERIQRGKGRYSIYPPSICRARDISTNFSVPVPTFDLPDGAAISCEDCRVIGWVVTDGYYSGRKSGRRYLNIQQSLSTIKNGCSTAGLMREVLEKRGASVYAIGAKEASQLTGTYAGRPFQASVVKNASQTLYFGKALTEHFERFLGSEIHRVPRWIMTGGSREQLEALLTGIVEGDGTNDGNPKHGWRGWIAVYCGNSEPFADDVLELCTRLGISATKRRDANTLQFIVSLTSRKRHWIRRTTKVAYSGTVWDVTVPTGAFIARRNGKVFVTGNCPERGYNESVATQAVIDIANLGRKRGFCLVPATQRLSKLSKNVVEPMQNYLVGRTTFDDQERAARVFKIKPGAETRSFSLELENLKDGQFIARGRAFNGDMMKVQVIRGVTRPPATGTAMAGLVTPTPEAVKALLPQLSDLPHEAEKKSKTEAELRTEIDELRRNLNARIDPAQIVALRRQIEEWKQNTIDAATLADSRGALLLHAAEKLEAIALELKYGVNVDSLASALAMEPPKQEEPVFPFPAKPVSQVPRSSPTASGPSAKMSRACRLILTVLAQHGQCSKARIAAIAGYSSTGGGFNNALSECRTNGWITGSDPLTATDDGIGALGPIEPLPSGPMLLQIWCAKVGKAEREILTVLAKVRELSKEQLAERTGYAPSGGGFNNAISSLRTLGLIDGKGILHLTPSFAEDIRR